MRRNTIISCGITHSFAMLHQLTRRPTNVGQSGMNARCGGIEYRRYRPCAGKDRSVRYSRSYSNSRSFHAFAERPLSDYLAVRLEQMQSYINEQGENYILNANETDFIDHVTETFRLDPPRIDFANVQLDYYSKQIPAAEMPLQFPALRSSRASRSFERQVAVYLLPFTGEADLLHCTPSTSMRWSTEVFVDGHDLGFEIVDYSEDGAAVKREADDILSKLPANAQNVVQEVERYNETLRTTVESAFKARKQTFLKRKNNLAALGVPIRRRDNLPQTYAIPTPEIRRSVSVKPVVMEQGFTPEPTLSQPDYESIVQTIHDVGKVMERLPSIYRERGEEDLRDLLLLYLEPRYEGSATGETFNGSGKTDILMRYLQSNVFVAECKFWSGEKRFLETLTQLFGYLTWRDSKAAAVIFVKRKDMSAVVTKVEEIMHKHSNYLGFLDKRDETWLNYRFHINGDRNREVKLAVLLFHLPDDTAEEIDGALE